jgi:hypothetical protein
MITINLAFWLPLNATSDMPGRVASRPLQKWSHTPKWILLKPIRSVEGTDGSNHEMMVVNVEAR